MAPTAPASQQIRIAGISTLAALAFGATHDRADSLVFRVFQQGQTFFEDSWSVTFPIILQMKNLFGLNERLCCINALDLALTLRTLNPLHPRKSFLDAIVNAHNAGVFNHNDGCKSTILLEK